MLTLFASEKNDYRVGPLITDGAGRVVFKRRDCEHAIDSAQKMFLMDYKGTLESCRPKIEVRLHSPEHIETMLSQYRKSPEFWGAAFNDPMNLFSRLLHVKNADYMNAKITATEAQILAAPHLVLLVMKRKS